MGKLKELDKEFLMNNDKSYPQPHCPNCNTPLRLITEKNDWFCDKCNIFPKTSKEIKSNIRYGSKKGDHKFWIISGIILFFAFIYFFYSSISTDDQTLQLSYMIMGGIAIGGYLLGILLIKFILK